MSRILTAFIFAAVIGIAAECQAQQGWLSRSARAEQGPRLFKAQRGPKFDNRQSPTRFKNAARPRLYDPRTEPDDDRWEQYPKYIGGFHASHYYNIGVPPGDIGFRGNGIYWAPWQ